jgi:hypothetical protein
MSVLPSWGERNVTFNKLIQFDPKETGRDNVGDLSNQRRKIHHRGAVHLITERSHELSYKDCEIAPVSTALRRKHNTEEMSRSFYKRTPFLILRYGDGISHLEILHFVTEEPEYP